MFRRLRNWLFGKLRPKYRALHGLHWELDALVESGAPGGDHYALYEHELTGTHPDDLWLPPHEPSEVSPATHPDAWPTQNMDAVAVSAPEPSPPVMGRDLLTGQPRLFGVATMALLHGVHAAMTLQNLTYFPAA